jgi:hypothetical protein
MRAVRTQLEKAVADNSMSSGISCSAAVGGAAVGTWCTAEIGFTAGRVQGMRSDTGNVMGSVS